MHLKSLKLMGFKSFVDPTTIPMESFFNAIVGPNGCGKSNIIDAVRWVIGETSAKQLRGQSMSDVIFSGSATRKPVGRAAVELLFDNSDGKIAGEYAGYTELAIRREVTREGQSNYSLNGSGCRRKDIIDLFLGTGLGPRSYSIIEQGMVSRLIEAKPEELRAFIEETAGISRYKERRRETENRIRHSKENLDRVNDICEELEKNLKHLQRQARAAERYKEYRSEERILQAQHRAIQWQSLNEVLLKKEEIIAESDVAQEAVRAEQQHVATELEREKVGLVEVNDMHAEIQREFYGLGAEIARLEQRIKHIQEQTEQWELELDQTTSLYTELVESLQESEEQVSSLELELAELTPKRSRTSEMKAEAEARLAAAEEQMAMWQSSWDRFQQALSLSIQQTEVTKTNIEHFKRELTSLTQREATLRMERESVQLAELAQAIQPLVLQEAEVDSLLEETTLSILNLNEKIQINRNSLRVKSDEVQQSERALSRLSARYDSLRNLQTSALENDETGKAWIEKHGLAKNERLAQTLDVVNGWELAVETVLMRFFDAVCTEPFEQLSELSQLPDASITLFDGAVVSGQVSSQFSPLLNQVKSCNDLSALLGGVYVASSVAEALTQRKQLAAHESFITQTGVWVGPNWVRVSKAADSEDSVLLREQEIKRLDGEIKTAEQVYKGLQAARESMEASLAMDESAQQAAQQQQRELHQQASQVKAKLSAKEARLEEITAAQARAEEAYSEVIARLDEVKTNLLQAESAWEQTAALQGDKEAERERLLAERDALQAELVRVRETTQRERQEADQIEIRITANEKQLALLKQTYERNQRQCEQLSIKREGLMTHLNAGNGEEPVDELNALLQAQLEKRVAVEGRLHAAADQVQQHQNTITHNEERRNQLAEKLLAMQSATQKLQLDRQTIVVNQQNLLAQITSKEFVLKEVLDGLPESYSEAEWAEQVEAIARRIQRLGPINLAAIDECKTLEERKSYLDSQQADLHEALGILESAIAKIDRETRQKFKETFEAVNGYFSKLFPKVFGGGSACLELTENDLLNTGVMIKAQPPGKKNATIHVLSGGEKALTAIALVFSFFHLNPAPFCILDEVDAPLDDANVGRFTRLIEEMSVTTQFLVISHNKVTIEAASSLLGVTMHEPGASRIVTVDMNQAVELAE